MVWFILVLVVDQANEDSSWRPDYRVGHWLGFSGLNLKRLLGLAIIFLAQNQTLNWKKSRTSGKGCSIHYWCGKGCVL